nr:MAG TPA: hypothetical protein [Caudoviricetes sp.]
MTLNNELITVNKSVLEKMMKLNAHIVSFLMFVTATQHVKKAYTIY